MENALEWPIADAIVFTVAPASKCGTTFLNYFPRQANLLNTAFGWFTKP